MMGSVLTAVIYLVALALVTVPFVILGCKIGDGIDWVMGKVLRLH